MNSTISLHTVKNKLKTQQMIWPWQCAGLLEAFYKDYSNIKAIIDDKIDWEYSGVFCLAWIEGFCMDLSFVLLRKQSDNDSSITLALFLHSIAQIVQLGIMTKD